MKKIVILLIGLVISIVLYGTESAKTDLEIKEIVDIEKMLEEEAKKEIEIIEEVELEEKSENRQEKPKVKVDKKKLVYYETGIASFYGGRWNGRKTASGQIFNSKKMTAAHKKLPFGTMVKVTNLSNGKSVVVRINDRGPFIKGRVIDLSQSAFGVIENTKKGITKVKLEIIK